MTNKKWQFYLNLSLIAFLALGVFSLGLKVLADNSWERLDFYNFHQAKDLSQKIIDQVNKVGKNQNNKEYPKKVNNGYELPILMYHYISPVPKNSSLPGLYLDPKIFAQQLEIINSQGYQSVFMAEVPEIIKSRPREEKYIALTFDDAYEDFYAQAWPLLKKYNIKSTLYVIVNSLGQPGYINQGQLQELANSNLVEIGSHTFNHPNLQTLDHKKAEHEIVSSRQALGALIGKNISSFAYPFGLYKTDTLDIVRQADYFTAVSTAAGSGHDLDNMLNLKRLRPNSRQGKEFKHWLETWY